MLRALEHHVPGLKEARAAEEKNRLLASLNVGFVIDGLRFSEVTLRHYCYLESIDHPFLDGKEGSPLDILFLLWVLHAPTSEAMVSESDRVAFYKKAAKGRWITTEKNLTLIKELLGQLFIRTFQDAPEGGKENPKVPTASYPITIHHLLAKHGYPFTHRELLDTPMTVIFQYLDLIEVSNGGHKISRSESLVVEWMREREAKRKAQTK